MTLNKRVTDVLPYIVGDDISEQLNMMTVSKGRRMETAGKQIFFQGENHLPELLEESSLVQVNIISKRDHP